MELKFENKFCTTLDGVIIPDYTNNTKEELAAEIVRLRRENNKLRGQLRDLSNDIKQITKTYLKFMDTANSQLHIPRWRRSRVAVPDFDVYVNL